MQNNKNVLAAALLGVMGVAPFGAQAAVVNYGDRLTLDAGAYAYDSFGNITAVAGGSYFAVDTDNNSTIATTEKILLSQGTTGIHIGIPTSPGASHTGNPLPGDTNEIDAPWSFFGNTGSTFTTVGITGSTTAGLDMSGWGVTWNSIPVIPLGTGAWQTGIGPHTGATGTFIDGIANFTWSGVYGTAYSLDYRATVPDGDPSGFGGVRYELHLEGVVNAVPVPGAVWLLGSGALGLLGVARRKRV